MARTLDVDSGRWTIEPARRDDVFSFDGHVMRSVFGPRWRMLIIGAGPIVIGQACEFDYSGVQACKALRAEGYRIVLVNSNPATIMTDPNVADATYIEPITPEMVEKIIAKVSMADPL